MGGLCTAFIPNVQNLFYGYSCMCMSSSENRETVELPCRRVEVILKDFCCNTIQTPPTI